MDVNGNKGSATDEIRMRNHRALLEQRHENEVRQVQDKQSDELQHLIEEHAYRSEKLRQDYEVQISREAEKLEERLDKVREDGDARIAQEKSAKELELSRMKSSYQQKLEEYRKHSEEQLAKLRKDLQQSSQTLYEQARASERAATAKTEKRS